MVFFSTRSGNRTTWSGRVAQRLAVPAVSVAMAITTACGSDAPTLGDDVYATNAAALTSMNTIERVRGNSLSSRYAEPSAMYLTVRQIGTLDQVGALSSAIRTVVQRADGIIANKPADGRISLDELIKLEQPLIFKSLFPDEQSALALVWPIMQTTDSSPLVIPDQEPQSVRVADVSTLPGPLRLPATLLVADQIDRRRTAAARMELLFDADANPATVSLADTRDALANQDPFTPDEVVAIQEIQNEFYYRAAPTTLSARVEVPVPGLSSAVLASFGNAALVRDRSLTYEEVRRISPNTPATLFLQAFQSQWFRVDRVPGERLLVLEEGTAVESILSGGPIELKGPTTKWTVEVWKAGIRQSSRRLTIPALIAYGSATRDYYCAPSNYPQHSCNGKAQPFHTDITAFSGYTLVAAGKPLYRNLVKRVSGDPPYYGGANYVRTYYSYDTASKPPGTNEDPRFETTRSSLPPGRYAGPGWKLDITPEGVVVSELRTSLLPLTVFAQTAYQDPNRPSYGYRYYTQYGTKDRGWGSVPMSTDTFDPATNVYDYIYLRKQKPNGSVSIYYETVQVKLSDRTG
jgi:hypothetical protein